MRFVVRFEDVSLRVVLESEFAGERRKGSFDTHDDSLCFWLRAARIDDVVYRSDQFLLNAVVRERRCWMQCNAQTGCLHVPPC
jgi:hypothetical protein